MLVRADDGEWIKLQPVPDLSTDDLRGIFGRDVSNLLELDEQLPVAAFSPDLGDETSAIDAICLTPVGGIALLAATFGEPARDTLWRLMSAAGALRGASVEAFAERLTELDGEQSPARWLAALTGGSLTTLDQAIEQTLRDGAFDLVCITSSGPGELRAPLRFLEAGPARVRMFEVEILRAGRVQAIEGVEVGIEGTLVATPVDPPSPHVVEPVPHDDAVVEEQSPAPQSQELVVEPTDAAENSGSAPEPGTTQESAPDPVGEVDAGADAPQDPVAASQEAVTLGEPSDERSFLAAVDRLDHRSSAHVRLLHAKAAELAADIAYTRDEHAEYLVGWLAGDEPRPLLGMDSRGTLQLVLTSLPEQEREEFANDVAGLYAEATTGAELLAEGVAELSIPVHLDDETLLQYLVDNLEEALPGGREKFAEAARAELEDDASDSDGSDYFSDLPSSEHHDQALPTPTPEPTTDRDHHRDRLEHATQRATGFARRLRRRDAA